MTVWAIFGSPAVSECGSKYFFGRGTLVGQLYFLLVKRFKCFRVAGISNQRSLIFVVTERPRIPDETCETLGTRGKGFKTLEEQRFEGRLVVPQGWKNDVW